MAEDNVLTEPAVAKDNYLGDPNVVEWLLRNYANNCIQRRTQMLDQRIQSAEMDVADAVKLAGVFLGQDPAYPPMENWNRPGVLDQWLLQELPLPPSEPVNVVRTCLVNFLLKMYKTMADFENTPEEFHADMVNGLVEEFTNLLIGNPDWNAE